MKILVNKNGEQLGPYSTDEVSARIGSSELHPTDLGWHEGLAAWTPLNLILGSSMNPLVPSIPSIPNSTVYAGFWRRVAALLIDYLIALIPLFAFGFIVGLTMGGNGFTGDDIAAVANILGAVCFWLYFASMESSALQATVGKIALGIRVTDEHGARIGFGRATGRHFGKFVSGIIFGIGFIIAGITARKQALHDMMAGCLIVCRR